MGDMMNPEIRGQITIKLLKNKEPDISFAGLVDIMDIQAAVYAIRTQFQTKYLDPIGDELKKKAAAALAARLSAPVAEVKKANEVKVPNTEVVKNA